MSALSSAISTDPSWAAGLGPSLGRPLAAGVLGAEGSQRRAYSRNESATAGPRWLAGNTLSSPRWLRPSGIETVNKAFLLAPGSLSCGDTAAVQPDQLLHQGQANTAALVGPGLGDAPAMEALEQMRHVLGGDADAGIRDAQHGLAVGGGQGQTAPKPLPRCTSGRCSAG